MHLDKTLNELFKTGVVQVMFAKDDRGRVLIQSTQITELDSGSGQTQSTHRISGPDFDTAMSSTLAHCRAQDEKGSKILAVNANGR